MTNNPLKIVSVDNKTPSNTSSNKSEASRTRRQTSQAFFDKAWHSHPEQFNPERNSLERERLNRTSKVILHHLNLEGKTIADLGCGSGILTHKLIANDNSIDAVDISEVALKQLKLRCGDRITCIHDFVPMTTLKDDHYDLVVSTELIAYLPQELFRLYFSELARIVKPEGNIVCSSSIDIYSDDALEKFRALAETEFEIVEGLYSYHRLTLQLLNFFKAPSKFVSAAKDPEYRHEELKTRKGLGHRWFSMNSSSWGSYPWLLVQYLFYPIVFLLSQNRACLVALEKICRWLYSDSGISHALFVGKKKKMFHPLLESTHPTELKHKKQVWE